MFSNEHDFVSKWPLHNFFMNYVKAPQHTSLLLRCKKTWQTEVIIVTLRYMKLTLGLYMNIETAQDKHRGAARKYYCNPSFGSIYNFVIIITHVYCWKPKHNRRL